MDKRETAWSCSNNKPVVEDLSSFIDAKVNDVCHLETEKLITEASKSYANELVISLQNENKDLQHKLQELAPRLLNCRDRVVITEAIYRPGHLIRLAYRPNI